MKFFLIFFSVFLMFLSCTDPKDIPIPSNLKAWETDAKLSKVIKNLPEDEQKLFAAYVIRETLGTVFRGDTSIEYATVGQAIELERKYIEEEKKENERREVLTRKLAQERLEATKKMNEVLTTSLVRLRFVESNWQAGTYTDFFDIRVAFKNNTEKNIEGVKGTVVLKDIFGELIKSIDLSDDKGIEAGKTRIYRGSMDYNQFMDDDNKLRSTDFAKITFEWVPEIYLFENSLSLIMPDGN